MLAVLQVDKLMDERLRHLTADKVKSLMEVIVRVRTQDWCNRARVGWGSFSCDCSMLILLASPHVRYDAPPCGPPVRAAEQKNTESPAIDSFFERRSAGAPWLARCVGQHLWRPHRLHILRRGRRAAPLIMTGCMAARTHNPNRRWCHGRSTCQRRLGDDKENNADGKLPS